MLTEDQLSSVPGIGKKSMEIIITQLELHGLALRQPGSRFIAPSGSVNPPTQQPQAYPPDQLHRILDELQDTRLLLTCLAHRICPSAMIEFEMTTRSRDTN